MSSFIYFSICETYCTLSEPTKKTQKSSKSRVARRAVNQTGVQLSGSDLERRSDGIERAMTFVKSRRERYAVRNDVEHRNSIDDTAFLLKLLKQSFINCRGQRSQTVDNSFNICECIDGIFGRTRTGYCSQHSNFRF